MRLAEAVRAVLFDLDGTLVQSYEVWFALLNAAARRFDAALIDRDTFATAWGQGVDSDVRRFFPDRSIAEVAEFYDDHFMDHVDRLRVEAGAVETVDALRRSGIGCALISQTPSPLARKILAHTGLQIGVVIGATDVAKPKPAPDMVNRACAELEVTPGTACVLGDSAYDRDAAYAAGVTFVGFRMDSAGDARIDALPELLALIGS
jgi:HAD superfamily hydrolase (TIGR01509 family)